MNDQMTTGQKLFCAAIILTFMALPTSLPIVPFVAAQHAANPSPLTVASLPTIGKALTSPPLTAAGAPGQQNVSVLCCEGPTLNFAVEAINYGFTGVNASWKSHFPFSQNMVIWFVVYNSKNQIVFASFVYLLFAAQESKAVFQTFSSALPSGIYAVYTFVASTSGAALSIAVRVTISF